MKEILQDSTINALLLLISACLLIIAGFVAVAYRRKDKAIYMTGRTWKVKQSAAQWMGRR